LPNMLNAFLALYGMMTVFVSNRCTLPRIWPGCLSNSLQDRLCK
jgi:hypothetical protein